jgi:hypothetical protein
VRNMNAITFATPWLASARPFAAAAAATQTKLPFATATRAQAPSSTGRGSTTFGTLAGVARLGIPAYVPVHTDRPMGDEQTNRNRIGGVRGPRYAWREPVTT